MNYDTVADFLLAFAYYYPLFMSYVWMCGGLYYRLHWENPTHRPFDDPLDPQVHPLVTVLVPCYNESAHIRETITYLGETAWPEYEIVAVNDGSSDDTGDLLDQLADEFPRLRVAHLKENRGKAAAMNVGAAMARGEYLICIDSDAILDPHAIHWLVAHLEGSPRVAAVTGNPRIRNRTTLLGKIQVGEFSSIIGLIKRAQRIYGRVFTVSGVVTAFRKRALQSVGYWSSDTVTDDIDISWRLQVEHWDIRYEPNALCWILMPETYYGLWRQRLRWAQGGVETALRYARRLRDWKSRRMWGVYAEYLLSVFWSYILMAVIVLWLLGKFVALPANLQVPSIVPGWHGVVLATTCLLQVLVSLILDSRYEKRLLRIYFWMVWYPLAYWMINVITVAVAVPTALLRKAGRRGRWISPDRGLQDRQS